MGNNTANSASVRNVRRESRRGNIRRSRAYRRGNLGGRPVRAVGRIGLRFNHMYSMPCLEPLFAALFATQPTDAPIHRVFERQTQFAYRRMTPTDRRFGAEHLAKAHAKTIRYRVRGSPSMSSVNARCSPAAAMGEPLSKPIRTTTRSCEGTMITNCPPAPSM